jgi:hypothetical protein
MVLARHLGVLRVQMLGGANGVRHRNRPRSISATRSDDKVALLFTDQVELFLPPRKGRRHILRVSVKCCFTSRSIKRQPP